MKCRKNTESKNPEIDWTKTKNNQQYKSIDSKKSKFINKQETRGLLSSLGIKKPLSKIISVGPLLL